MDSHETYHLHFTGQRRGPYTLGQIRHMYLHKLIPVEAMYLREGMEQWQPVEELFYTERSQWRRKAAIVTAITLGSILTLLITLDIFDLGIDELWHKSGLSEWLRKFIYIWFYRSD